MRLFSYKQTHDTGFAPNPFWGCLTLATCKPGIRRTKRVGDWLAGFTSGKLCGDPVGEERLIYLMQVEEKRPIAEYFLDKRFAKKIPNQSSGRQIDRAGDNIYKPRKLPALTSSDFRQLPNDHHFDNQKGCGVGENQAHDLSGINVLISRRFVYFGIKAIYIPREMRPSLPAGMSLNGSQTHDIERAKRFVDYVFSKSKVAQVVGSPHAWNEGDLSWQVTE